MRMPDLNGLVDTVCTIVACAYDVCQSNFWAHSKYVPKSRFSSTIIGYEALQMAPAIQGQHHPLLLRTSALFLNNSTHDTFGIF
jgi:hypothetical protein